MIPPGLKPGTNRSEREVFSAFEGITNRPEWKVLHSLSLARNLVGLEGEADFIVIVPEKGIVVVETKKPNFVEYKDGSWYLDKLPNPTKDPLHQLNRARSSIRSFIKDFDENVDEIPIARLLWFTSIGRHQFENKSPGDMQFFEWELGLAEDKTKPVDVIEKLLDRHIDFFAENSEVHYKPESFTQERAEAISEHLLADFKGYETAEDIARSRYSVEQRMLDEQLTILELIETNNHVYFDGGAGTGKSFLLAQAARNVAKSGKKSLVTCWNYMMAEELASTLNRPGMTVTDLNSLMLQICGLDKNPDDAGTQWYENDLPQLAIDALEKNPTLGGYEAIFIDEFQDIAGNTKLLGVIVGLLRKVKVEDAIIVLAGDRNQQIMRDGDKVVNPITRAKVLIPDLVHVRLRTNCRTVPELAKLIPQVIDVDTDIVRHRIPEGFKGGLEIVHSSDEKQAQHLATVIKGLLKRYHPRDIVILSPFGEKNSTVGQLLQNGPKTADERVLVAQLETDSGDGKIRWRSMAKFKGLESPVVVITDVNDKAKEFATNTQKKLDELLYVGITRAKYECVIIGDAIQIPLL